MLARVYNLKADSGVNLGTVILTEGGMISFDTDWGTSSYRFGSVGDSDFRVFVHGLGEGYLAQKLQMGLGYMFPSNPKNNKFVSDQCHKLVEKVFPALRAAIQEELMAQVGWDGKTTEERLEDARLLVGLDNIPMAGGRLKDDGTESVSVGEGTVDFNYPQEDIEDKHYIISKTSSLGRVYAERVRQVDEEGYDAEHDSMYNGNELTTAAAFYLLRPEIHGELTLYLLGDKSVIYPFPYEYWKPTPENRMRELEKGIALALAEFDRLIAEDLSEKAAETSAEIPVEPFTNENTENNGN